MFMRRITVLAVAALLSLGLTACGGKDNSSSISSNQAKNTVTEKTDVVKDVLVVSKEKHGYMQRISFDAVGDKIVKGTEVAESSKKYYGDSANREQIINREQDTKKLIEKINSKAVTYSIKEEADKFVEVYEAMLDSEENRIIAHDHRIISDLPTSGTREGYTAQELAKEYDDAGWKVEKRP